ncbi:hypothetical protein BCR43DRAFT_86462 [Syncephalastrum racemosum]|uniref:Nuclear pore complex protein NUP96 C-terminal domain-containing protein n=1 Tax=Syncephalastrum racemosum TaxID=13706 RepID=A0A1X2H366_SYNRA|nr:hypothetical protein BCR43DRAFT_86462 [Syncephalastrum racemosum]
MQTVEKQSSITIQDDISHIKLRTSISSNLWTYGGLDGYSALEGEEKRWWKLSLILLDKETKPKQQWAQLKEWFRELFAEAYDDINAKEDSYDTVLQYLCTGNIREATLAASRLGDHATATMIPYPKTHSVQEQLKQQIAQWKADKSWSKRPASFRSIWRILTGDLKNALATLEHTTLRYHMIFGLFLFHGSNRSAEEPVDTLIRGYLSSRTREDDLREKEDPFRPYVEFIQWWWLTRYADAKKKYPPPRLIPQIVLAHCPISLGWRLTREYAFELGGAKNWTQRWSLHLVRMQLPRPALLAALFEPDAGHIIRLLSFVDCNRAL